MTLHFTFSFHVPCLYLPRLYWGRCSASLRLSRWMEKPSSVFLFHRIFMEHALEMDFLCKMNVTLLHTGRPMSPFSCSACLCFPLINYSQMNFLINPERMAAGSHSSALRLAFALCPHTVWGLLPPYCYMIFSRRSVCHLESDWRALSLLVVTGTWSE